MAVLIGRFLKDLMHDILRGGKKYGCTDLNQPRHDRQQRFQMLTVFKGKIVVIEIGFEDIDTSGDDDEFWQEDSAISFLSSDKEAAQHLYGKFFEFTRSQDLKEVRQEARRNLKRREKWHHLSYDMQYFYKEE